MIRLSEMSEGNFMYLWYILNDIASSPELDLDRFMAQLPHGLVEYYKQHKDLMGITAEDAPTVSAWILYVLCEAECPLPAWVISSVLAPFTSEMSAAFVRGRLNKWLQFLHVNNAVSPAEYSLYHASFRDYLHRDDVIASAGMDLKNVNQVMADIFKHHLMENDGI